MTWNEAAQLIRTNIHEGLDLDPANQFKIVVEIPPYRCRNFNNEEGYRVQVGQSSFVNIPISMLKLLFETSVDNNGIYNNSIFARYYQQKLNGKPCYVHSIGKMFFKADVMEIVDGNNYRILD
jgi:hypothetical protein